MNNFKIWILVTLALQVSDVVFANDLNFADIVLVKDVLESPANYNFPCSVYIDEVFCSRTLILERGCAATLEISDDTLSCTPFNSLSRVNFGTYSEKDRTTFRSSNGSLVYRINYDMSRVSIRSFKTPNGNREYQMIVK